MIEKIITAIYSVALVTVITAAVGAGLAFLLVVGYQAGMYVIRAMYAIGGTWMIP